MKTTLIFLISCLACILPCAAQSAAETAKASLSAEQWTLVNAALIEQREALNAAHVASIAKFTASYQQSIADLTKQLGPAQAAQARAESKLKVLVDGAKDALSKKTSEERLAAGNALLSKVQASQSEEEKVKLQAQQVEIAAKLAALEAK